MRYVAHKLRHLSTYVSRRKRPPIKTPFLLGSANVEAWHLERPAILIYEVAALKQEDLVDEPDT